MVEMRRQQTGEQALVVFAQSSASYFVLFGHPTTPHKHIVSHQQHTPPSLSPWAIQCLSAPGSHRSPLRYRQSSRLEPLPHGLAIYLIRSVHLVDSTSRRRAHGSCYSPLIRDIFLTYNHWTYINTQQVISTKLKSIACSRS